MRRPEVRPADALRAHAGRGELTMGPDIPDAPDVPDVPDAADAADAPDTAAPDAAPRPGQEDGAMAPARPPLRSGADIQQDRDEDSMVMSPAAARRPWPADAGEPTGPPAAPGAVVPAAPHGPATPGRPDLIAGSAPEPVTPGPPGGVLDLAALAAVERRLRATATAAVEDGVRSGRRSPAAARSERAGVAAASSIATVLWFDSLRAEDRVSVTPRAAALVHAVHHVLEDARVAGDPIGGPAAGDPPAGWLRPDGAPPLADSRPLRVLGAGNVGPSGTVWAALARRYAGERFDRTPRGRQICLIDYAELRDPAVWETIADERAAHLGELLWVVMVTGTSVSAATGGPGGIGGPGRAARLFEAAGWQVLTVRYGRRLEALFRAPGGHALRSRLDLLTPAEFRDLLHARGADLRRRLAGPGTAGAGISRLLDTLTDEQILACLGDLGGHDIPLLIDAFDEVAADRPTVLFAYTGDRLAPEDGPYPAADTSRRDPPAPAAAQLASRNLASRNGAGAATDVDGAVVALSQDPAARRLARHVARYLDRAPVPLRSPAPVPAHAAARRFPERISTQEAFGDLLRDLPRLAPQAAAAVVTISTRAADPVLAGWLAAAGEPSGGGTASPGSTTDPASRAEPAIIDAVGGVGGGVGGATDLMRPGGADDGEGDAPAGRHVAGGLSAAAFGGVLGSLGVAWSRQGLPLLPIGVADEVSAGRVLPGWLAAGSADARSVLAVADTGLDPITRALAWNGGDGAPAGIATTWVPAFAHDLAWCLLAGLGRLARLDGASSLIQLSARPVDQRLAELPVDADGWRRRRALVLAGGYRLHEGGPAAAITLVGVGPVMPEVLRAAAELRSGLGHEVTVVCLTSPGAVFQALQARRGLAEGSDALLAELFPADRRCPMVTVVDGDPRALSFLAGVHGDPISTLGSATPPPDAAGAAVRPGTVPVTVDVIVGTALDLLDETATAG
ncbi:pyruvate dehydrogenase [Frankia sp. ACN1ag]|uniref:pyruvate dehydrogenase n=1 Tax=Frankia sp. ACN1ag TaxID=102891 RepID=UPI0037C18321